MTPFKSLRPRNILLVAALGAQALTALGQDAPPAGTLEKRAVPIDGNRNGSFEVDETVQYTLTFTNTGGVDLTDVVLRDPSSGCIQFDTGSVVIEPASGGTSSSSGSDVQVDLRSPLLPSEVVTVTFVGSATASGSCCNQATWSSVEVASGVSDQYVFDGIANQPTCHVASAVPGPDDDAIIDIQVLTTGCLQPNSIVEFRVRIQNTGRGPLRNAAFLNVLHPALGNVVVDAGLSYDVAAHAVYVDPRTYGVGEETLYTYRVQLPCTERGILINTATLTFEDRDGNVYTRRDAETITWGRPDLWSSTKRWNDDPADGDVFVAAGENVTFTITLRNTGLCEALDVVVTDILDQRLMGTAPELVIPDGGTFDPFTRAITWTSATTPQLAAVQPGTDVVLTFTTQIEPGTPAGFIPNSVTIDVLGNDPGDCTALPSLSRSLLLQNGSVAFGAVAPTFTLLRNDYVSCLAQAFLTIRGNHPVSGSPPVLVERLAPQECSSPSAINPDHPETYSLVDPGMPYVFQGDAAPLNAQCPQMPVGSGRVLIFYELLDDCTTTLRVHRDPLSPGDIVVSW